MIKVGFTIIGGKTSWMGGVNYLKNLLFAISQIEDKKIYPVLFVGKKMDINLLKEFDGFAEIRKDSLFDKFSFKWIVDLILREIFNINPFVNQIVRENDIKVLSHSYIYGKDLECYTLNWIPDFQHIRLPHMFSRLHFFVRNYRLKALAKYSDMIMLSSYDALNDFKQFLPQYLLKTRVVHFVSQTSTIQQKNREYLEKKYCFKGNFFFLPNQFWAHKNHKIAFEAIKLAKQKYPDILLLCSGHLVDERNNKHIEKLKQYVTENSLEDNIKLLGLIPFNDVLLLMQYSISIINPSSFEGWSSTVEEAKSMNKSLILSNIPVHIEQAPPLGTFFDPFNANELSAILKENWMSKEISMEHKYDREDLRLRTLKFAEQYQSIVLEIFNDKKL